MSPLPRPRGPIAGQHLGEMLRVYADRSLPVAAQRACDQHVSICPACRASADAERRLLSSLRTAATPAPSSRLDCALRELATHAAPQLPGNGPSPLPVMGRCAPAMYRSPLRAAMLASLVAGASAAAAWSLGVNTLGPPGASFSVARPPSSVTTLGAASAAGWSSHTPSFLSTSHTSVVAGPWPTVPNGSRRSAQSNHE